MAISSVIDEHYASKMIREEKAQAGKEGAEQAEKSAGSFRHMLAMARNSRNKKEQAKEAAKEKVKSAATSPLKQGTSSLLKFSWLNLVDSFGLTLIYINMHVFLRWIFPSMFCKLGEEWMPKQVSVLNSGANEAAGVGRYFGIVEVIGLLILDLLFIIILIGVISSIMMILDMAYAVIGWFIEWFSQVEPNIVA